MNPVQLMARLTVMLVAVGCAQQRPTGERVEQVSIAAPGVVAYRVTPAMAADRKIAALDVEMTFAVDADGATLVRMPWRYAGRDDLLSFVSDIAVEGGALAETERPAEKRVMAAPNQLVTLSYRVRSGIAHEPTSADGQPFAPWILSDWFMIDGSAFFARPQVDAATPATFAWGGDAAMPFASDLQRFATPQAGGTVGDVFTATLLGGKGVRMLERGGTRLALRGAFPFSDYALLDGVVKLIEAERGFWGDDVAGPYLVTMVSVPKEPGFRAGFAGTGHGGDAFAAVISGEVRFRDLMGKLFAHEIFHGWMPDALGVAAKPREAWFGEGFTEYYGRLLPLRAGVVSLDDFAATWNEALLEYAISPAKNLDQARLADEHWTDFNAEMMPYLRGSMLAAMWAARFRNEGSMTLDERLRRRRGEAADGSRLDAEQLMGAMEPGLAEDIAAYVVRGETIKLAPDTFGKCLRVEDTAIPSYDRGFDFEASVAAGMIATGVRADGPAYAAGLREGMQIVRPVSGRTGDSTQDTVLLVASDGRERTLSWRPAGAGEVLVQRLVRVDGAPDDGARCGI